MELSLCVINMKRNRMEDLPGKQNTPGIKEDNTCKSATEMKLDNMANQNITVVTSIKCQLHQEPLLLTNKV